MIDPASPRIMSGRRGEEGRCGATISVWRGVRGRRGGYHRAPHHHADERLARLPGSVPGALLGGRICQNRRASRWGAGAAPAYVLTPALFTPADAVRLPRSSGGPPLQSSSPGGQVTERQRDLHRSSLRPARSHGRFGTTPRTRERPVRHPRKYTPCESFETGGVPEPAAKGGTAPPVPQRRSISSGKKAYTVM